MQSLLFRIEKRACHFLFRRSRGEIAWRIFPKAAKEAMDERVEKALKAQIAEWERKQTGERK
jgi:hypothetical protein